MISDSVKAVYGEVGLRRLAEEQRAKLLPQLGKKRTVLAAKRAYLDAQIEEIEAAIADVEDGKITDYQLRQSRKGGEEVPA